MVTLRTKRKVQIVSPPLCTRAEATLAPLEAVGNTVAAKVTFTLSPLDQDYN